MPNVIRVDPGMLGAVIRQDAQRGLAAVRFGMLAGAHRGRAHLVPIMPVDRGILKNAWRIVKLSGAAGGCELVNDAPYAGIIERGARPHKMSKEAIESLTSWVKRVILRASKPKGGKAKKAGAFTDWDAEAKGIALAIARKFAKEGRAGGFQVRSSMPKLVQWVAEETMRAIAKYFAKRGGAPGKGP